MSRLLWILFLFQISQGLAEQLAEAPPPLCPPRFIPLKTGCYYFGEKNSKNFWDARELCLRLGGHMVAIDDEEEDLLVVGEAKKRGEGGFFLGAYDVGHEGKWTWDHSGQVLSYSNWVGSQPDNYKGVQHCSGVGTWSSFTWDDTSCEADLKPLCEAAPLSLAGLSCRLAPLPPGTNFKLQGQVDLEVVPSA